MELKITKEKVLEAASQCSTAKETLKVLFPEVFVEDYEESWTALTDNISGFIDDSGKFSYDLWRMLPGDSSYETAEWIVNQIKSSLK